jgi:hypothetical protein
VSCVAPPSPRRHARRGALGVSIDGIGQRLLHADVARENQRALTR